jgi:hypothetical protein
MGAPIALATAAVAYGGGHWVIVMMLAMLAMLVGGHASFEAWRSGGIVPASWSAALVAVPVLAASLLLANRDVGSISGVRKEAAAVERTNGLVGSTPGQASRVDGTTDLLSFTEVAETLRIAQAGRRADVQNPEQRFALNRVRAWEAVGIAELDAVDPSSGRPLLPAARRENLIRAKRTFEDKLALHGRGAMLNTEEAAWAAHTLR